MSSIKMFHAPWMGIEALTIVVVGKQHPKAIEISLWRYKTPLRLPKQIPLGSILNDTCYNTTTQKF